MFKINDNKAIDIKRYRRKNCLIIFSFIILSIFSCILLLHNGVVYGGSDTAFQWQRIMELKKSFEHFNFFPQLAIYQYSNFGSAVMALYPYINLFPIVILSFIIKNNILLIYVAFMVKTFCILIFSYYSSYGFYRKFSTSYLFSLFYGLSGMFLSYNFRSMDLGVVTVIIALPLVIFGFLALLNNGSWLELTSGMSIIVFSHVLSIFFITFFLIVWFLINIKKVNKIKITALCKAIILTLCITSVVWVSAVAFYKGNSINPPIVFALGGTDFSQLIQGSISFSQALSTSAFIPGIFSILGLILVPILYLKRLNPLLKQMYILGLAVMLLSSNVFPWNFFQNTPISILQFPWRLFIIPQLLLSYVLAYSITNYLKVNYREKAFYIFALLAICMQGLYQHDMIQSFNHLGNQGSRPLAYVVSPTHPIVYDGGTPVYSLSTSHQFSYLTKNKFFTADYIPKQSLVDQDLLQNQEALYNVDKKLPFKYVGDNTYKFSNDTDIAEFNLPFVTYNNQTYSVFLDGKFVPSKANIAKLLTINNIPSGEHTVVIKCTSNSPKFSIFISIFSTLLYLYLIYNKIGSLKLKHILLSFRKLK